MRSGEAEQLEFQLNHNPLGETNSHGVLVNDGLVPFSRNRIEFKPEDLGFDFSIANVDYNKFIVPVSTGGYVVEFPIKEQFPATVKLIDGADQPLPSGTLVFNLQTEETSGIATDGLVYFENVEEGHRLEADMGRFGKCETEIKLGPKFEKFDEIGPFVCE